MKKQILAVILNYNELDLTKKSVRSLKEQYGAFCDILVVDNHSEVDPKEALLENFKNIFFIRNKRNLGVAGGRNLGIKFGMSHDYEFIFFFDNDARADRHMLSNLIKSASNNKDAAVFGPKILSDGKNNVIWRAGCTSWKWTYLHSLSEIFRRITKRTNINPPAFMDTIRGENQIDRGQYDREESVDFQIGCAQLIRTDVFRQIGILDEEFNPYGSEDIDFCARVKKGGWQIRYVPSAICWHRVGGCFRDSYQRSYYNMKNILLLARKNLNPVYFWFLFLPDAIVITLPLMWIESIIKKNEKKRKAMCDALKWHIKDIQRRGVFI